MNLSNAHTFPLFLSLVAAILTPASGARAGLLVAVTSGGSSPPVLFDVDRTTGAFSNARATGLPAVLLTDVEFDGAGTLFAVSGSAGGTAAFQNSLFRIDVTTGTATKVGATGLTQIAEGDLAYDPITDTLFGSQNARSGFRDVFTVNRTTGAATVIGSIASSGDFSGMAVDQRTGDLYLIDDGGSVASKLLRISKTDASILSQVTMSLDLPGMGGFDYDPVLDKFLVPGGGGSAARQVLYTVDLQTGVLTEIGRTGSSFTTGLATFGPVPSSVPEPGTATLAFIAGISFFVSGLQRRTRRVRAETQDR